MAKMIEVNLHSLTCEFAGDEGDDLEVGGILSVQAYNDLSVIRETKVIYDFSNGPLRMRKGESVAIDRDARIVMATPSSDSASFGSLNVRFGGELTERDMRPVTDVSLGSQWQALHTNEVINVEPRMWRMYFGRNDQIVRADFSTVYVHPL